MTDFLRRTWAQIDLDALAGNIRAIRGLLAPGCRLMSIVKADAYGHGDRYCARALADHGADWFGVSNIDEALSLRSAGIEQPILILGTTPPEMARALFENRITQTVFSSEYASRLSRAAVQAGATLEAHLKIDTGMNRIGFDGFDADCAGQALEAARLPGLRFEGAFTHFSCADEDSSDAAAYTRAQFERFARVLGELESAGLRLNLRHCCNSAATLRYPEMHLDMVRPGLIQYGLLPDPCCAQIAALTPVMQLKSVVSMVKTIPAGRFVSYGRTLRTERETVVATVPIGYADGYHRSLSNLGEMLLRGRRARVLGRVCMDQLMLDVTHIPGTRPGDEVTVFGSCGGDFLPIESMAAAAGSLNYEMVCLIGKRVPRLYLRNAEPCGVAQYHRLNIS